MCWRSGWIRIRFLGEREVMLCLSRKKDEQIRIGDNIVITIVEIRGDKVRIGIDAPRETAVHRQEVWVAIKKESEGHAS